MAYGKAAKTPSAGPWRWIAGINRYDDDVQILMAADGSIILQCLRHDSPQFSGDTANVNLLEAAPDMLAALRRAVLALAFAAESSAAMRDDYNAISAAIAKATGAA